MPDVTKKTLLESLKNGTICMDDFLNLPYNMPKAYVGRVLCELYYCLYQEVGGNSKKANDALYGALLDIWEDDLEE